MVVKTLSVNNFRFSIDTRYFTVGMVSGEFYLAIKNYIIVEQISQAY